MDKLAKEGHANPDYKLPTPKVDGKYDFSFSGLKTAVLQLNQRLEKKGIEVNPADMAYAFQETALGSLTSKTIEAVKEYKPKMVVLAGGVAANSRIRAIMEERIKECPDTKLIIPPLKYCTDNAAMIGAVGYAAYKHKAFGDFEASADPGLMMPGEI